MHTEEERRANLKKAHRSNIGRRQTAEHRRKSRLGNIPVRPKGDLFRCRICRFLGYTWSGYEDRGETHGVCWWGWLRAGNRGYPPPIPGPRITSEELKDSFELAVRHLIRDEKIGDTRGGGLAARFALGRRGANARIDTLLDRFPADDRGGKQITFWRDALLEERERRRSERR